MNFYYLCERIPESTEENMYYGEIILLARRYIATKSTNSIRVNYSKSMQQSISWSLWSNLRWEVSEKWDVLKNEWGLGRTVVINNAEKR